MVGDSYRPSEYDFGRRVSYPNPTWRKEPSTFGQPQRPSGPVRGNTMDSSRDPRRKRQQSRSPDRAGAPARKAPRPQQFRGAPAGPAVDNHSRQSSVSNGTPKHSNGLGSSPSRRDSIQPLGNANQGGGSTIDNSPNGRDSPVRNGSGRTTPMNKPNGASTPSSKVSAAVESPKIALDNASATAAPNSVLVLLTSISGEIATQASLQISRDQAKARADRLQLEYNSTREKFAAFPAIKERKTLDKNAAIKEMETRDVKLKEHKASQGELMSKLATMISQNVSSTDHVSRAEYDHVTKELDAAKDLIKNMYARIDDITVTAGAASTTAEATSTHLDTHQKATGTALEEVRAGIKKVSTDIDIQKGVGKTFVTKHALETFEKQLKQERDQLEAKGAGTIKDLDEVKQSVENLSDVAKRVDKLELDAKKDIANPASADIGAASNNSSLAGLADIDSRLKEVEAFVEHNSADLIEDIAQQSDREIGKIYQHVLNTDGARLEDIRNLRETITALEQTMKEIQASTSQSVTMEGLKNFETSIQSDLSVIKNDIRSVKSQQQQQHSRSASQSSFMPQPPPLQYPPGPQQMPSSMAHSPQLPNGTHRSPSLQNGPPIPQSPTQAMQQLPSSSGFTPDIYKKMQAQIDGAVASIQSLKQRWDNVQTDEVVKLMLKQVNEIYPHLSNYDAAVKSLRLDVDQEKKARETFVAQISTQLNEMKNIANQAFKMATDTTKAGGHHNVIVSLQSSVSALADQVSEVHPKIQDLDNGLKTVSKTANAVDKLSKELSTKFNAATEKVEGEFKRAHGEMDLVKERLAVCEGHVEAAEIAS